MGGAPSRAIVGPMQFSVIIRGHAGDLGSNRLRSVESAKVLDRATSLPPDYAGQDRDSALAGQRQDYSVEKHGRPAELGGFFVLNCRLSCREECSDPLD